jgi:hypothetical protein
MNIKSNGTLVLRTALFWAITQQEVVKVIDTIFKTGPIACPETSLGNSHYSLRNNTEGRSSQLFRGRSLKSREPLYIAAELGLRY